MAVSDQIIAILDELCRRFGIVVDWTSANVVPYLEELCGKLISYEIWTSVTWIAILTMIVVVLWIANKFVWKKMRDGEIEIIFAAIAVVVTIVAFCFVCFQIFDIITCVTLPEKIIFEQIKYIASTLK